MIRTLTKSAILLLTALLSLGTLVSAETAQKRHAASKPSPAQVAVQQSPMPLQPPTPEQMPAQPPHVTFQNGLLAINADNSNLSDVLSAVHTALGIGIDTPPSGAPERVVVHLGPGQPRDVLSQLLAGSRYDYILVGTAQNSDAVSQVILTARQSANAAPGNATQQPVAAQPNYSPMGGVMTADDDSEPDDTAQQPEPSAAPQLPSGPAGPYQANQPNQATQPNNPYQQNAPPAADSGGEKGPGSQVKTPEQLLQELQRMQQQQQQQQQQPQNRPHE